MQEIESASPFINRQGIHALREDSRALRLVSQLPDLRAANANLQLLHSNNQGRIGRHGQNHGAGSLSRPQKEKRILFTEKVLSIRLLFTVPTLPRQSVLPIRPAT